MGFCVNSPGSGNDFFFEGGVRLCVGVSKIFRLFVYASPLVDAYFVYPSPLVTLRLLVSVSTLRLSVSVSLLRLHVYVSYLTEMHKRLILTAMHTRNRSNGNA